MRDSLAAIVVGLVALAAPGCQVEEDVVPGPEPSAQTIGVETARDDEPPIAPLALRAWLEQRSYRDDWELWPGTAPLHPGAEGHGALHTTRVSPAALDALGRGRAVLPTGSVVILDEHSPDSLLSAVDVMIQAGGSEAADVDWHFARFGSAGDVEPIAMCPACHVRDPDWLFSGELGRPLPVDSTGAGPESSGTPDSL